MIKDVGRLGGERRPVTLHGRERRLDGLLAELLRRRRRAGGDELRRIRLGGRRGGSFGDDAGEVGERESRHVIIRIGSPACAI
jgi:hypothetical protein